MVSLIPEGTRISELPPTVALTLGQKFGPGNRKENRYIIISIYFYMKHYLIFENIVSLKMEKYEKNNFFFHICPFLSSKYFQK